MVRVGDNDVAGNENYMRKSFGCGEELELLSLRGVSEVWSSDAAGTTEYPENSQTPELPVAEATDRGAGADAAVDLRSIDWGPHLSGLEWGQTPFEAGKHWVKRGLPPPIKAAEGEV